MSNSDSILKVLVGAACIAVIAAVGFYFYTVWAAQPSEIDVILAKHQDLMRRMQQD